MNRIKEKIILSILIFGILLLGICLQSNAATISVSPSKSSVAPGETFSVTVSVSNGAGKVSASTSNGSGSLGNTWLDNGSTSFSVTAGSAGTVAISASGTIADYTTGEDEYPTGYASVSIIQPSSNTNSSGGSSSSSSSSSYSSKKPITTTNETKKSSDSSLRNLSINEGTISPEFSKDVFEYTMDVANEITNATVNVELGSSKANCNIEGNKDLQIGENTVLVMVTAEDGSTSTYTIKVNRINPALALKSLIFSTKDENGLTTELSLTPLFSGDITEYVLEKISYTISQLDIEAIANIEGAEVKIEGNEDLKAGNNVITIMLKLPQQISEETGELLKKEEIKVYTINVEKEEDPIPPTFFQRIGNWFTGLFGGVKNWYDNNTSLIKSYALIVCATVILGFTVYLIFDYKKYQDIMLKIKKVTEINDTENQEVSLDNNNDIVNEQKIEETSTEKRKQGRHF